MVFANLAQISMREQLKSSGACDTDGFVLNWNLPTMVHLGPLGDDQRSYGCSFPFDSSVILCSEFLGKCSNEREHVEPKF